MDLFQQKFDKRANTNMCAEFYNASLRRGTDGACPTPDFSKAYEKFEHECLASDPVPGLADGYMTIQEAYSRCSTYYDGEHKCMSFWYYEQPHQEENALKLEDNVTCDVTEPQYGMRRITDKTCLTAKGDAAIGCIGAENPTCSRCVYNMKTCRTIWDRAAPGMCERFVRAAKMRRAPSCIPLPDQYWVEFSSKDRRINETTHPGACPKPHKPPPTNQLGAAADGADPIPTVLFFQFWDNGKGTVLQGGHLPLPQSKQYLSLADALNACVANKNAKPNCEGVIYQNPNAGGFPTGGSFHPTFVKGSVTKLTNAKYSYYKASWPSQGSAAEETVVV